MAGKTFEDLPAPVGFDSRLARDVERVSVQTADSAPFYVF